MRAALVLAAGASRRFGRGDKLQARVLGQALVAHAVARATGAGRILIVIPRRHPGLVPGPTVPQALRPIVRTRGGRNKSGVTGGVVVARDARLGMGASLEAGLAALRPIEREVMIFLGDMPFAAMPRGMRLGPGIDAMRPVFRGKPGHPLLVRAAVARRIVRSDDRGLIGGLARERTAFVRGTAGNLLDIDTPAALVRVRRRIAGAQGRVMLGRERR